MKPHSFVILVVRTIVFVLCFSFHCVFAQVPDDIQADDVLLDTISFQDTIRKDSMRIDMQLILDSCSIEEDAEWVNMEMEDNDDDAAVFETYMTFEGRRYSQGGANYGRYLFVGNDKNQMLDVYDLDDKCFLYTIPIQGASQRCHSNTLNFGKQFYHVNDEFPLLYISSGYLTSPDDKISDIYVYRIQRNIDEEGHQSFKATQVQIIELQGYGSWTECICDNEHDAIWIRCSLGGKRSYLKFPVPDVSIAKVRLSKDIDVALDTIMTDEIPALKSNQGYFCQDGYIYFSTGVPGQVPFWVAISLDKHDYEYIVKLFEVDGYDATTHQGLYWETEFFFSYNGEYYLGYRNHIQKVNLEKVKSANFFYNRYRITR